MANAQAVTAVTRANSGTDRRWRKPAATSRRNDPGGAGSGADSVTRTLSSAAMAAATVATSSTATAPPPKDVRGPAVPQRQDERYGLGL